MAPEGTGAGTRIALPGLFTIIEAIAGVPGVAMQEFAGLDGKVHDLSVQIREMAREGEGPDPTTSVHGWRGGAKGP